MYTPLDIENKKFAKQMVNGYNVEEVDDFLDELTIDYEKIYKQSGEATKKIADMEEELQKYKNIEYQHRYCQHNTPESIHSLNSIFSRQTDKNRCQTGQYHLSVKLSVRNSVVLCKFHEFFSSLV